MRKYILTLILLVLFSSRAFGALQNDNFNDNSLDAFWDTGTVASGTVAEQNGRIEVDWTTSQSDFAWIVTDSSHDLSTSDIQISVTANASNAGMWIVLTKTTTTNPYNENDWYRVIRYKASGSWSYYVQKKTGGGSASNLATASTSETGDLRITISGGTITFYVSGSQVAQESYGLSSATAYVYLVGGLDEGTSNDDAFFDDFVASSGAADPCDTDCTECADQTACEASPETCYWYNSTCNADPDPCESDCSSCSDQTTCEASAATCYWYSSTCNSSPAPASNSSVGSGKVTSGRVK